MKLSEIFNQLAYGELSQMGVVDQDTGLIRTDKYVQMLSHVNLGLTALYKRFPLKEGSLTFSLEKDKTHYPLTTAEDVDFITVAGEEDFSDDILKVERVYTSNGVELALNDHSDSYACSTPSATMLRVPLDVVNKSLDLPTWLHTDTLKVVYRANHPVITYSSSFNPARVDVELPMSHLEPLLLFVASRVNNPIGMTNEFNAGNNYAAKYERACQQLETVNLLVDQGSQNDRLERNGWA